MSKGKSVGQNWFQAESHEESEGAVMGVAVDGVADPTVTMERRETRNQRMQELLIIARVSKIAKAATIPRPKQTTFQTEHDKVKGVRYLQAG